MTSPTPEAGLSKRIDTLSATADALNAGVRELGEALKRTRREQWRDRIVAGVVVFVDVSLTLGIYLLWNSQADTNRRIQAATDRATAVQTHIVGILCPLYKLFVDSYDPKVRAAMTPAGQAHYDTQYAIITRGYADLDCVAISGAAKTPPPVSPSPSGRR